MPSRTLVCVVLLCAACNLERRQATGPENPVAQVFVAPNTVTIDPLTSSQFQVYGRTAAGDSIPVSARWSASAGTITQQGLFTADSSEDDVMITASYSERFATTTPVTGTALVHKGRVIAITLTPERITLGTGQKQQFTAKGIRNRGDTVAVSVAFVAGGGTITASGFYTAGASAGSFRVIATHAKGYADTSAVTLTLAPPSPPPPPPPPPAPPPPPGSHAGWYAAPSGTSGGDGSAARPWNLQTALNGGNGRVQPGDTIWLRGGTYAGLFYSNLTGTANAWIVVRQYPGERATLDGGTTQDVVLTIDGAYTMYWGFEIIDSGTQRYGLAGTGTPLRSTGVYTQNASNIKLINLIVHDVGHGIYTENTSHNIEIYGWIVYNGGNEDGNRSDGHGIYIKGDGIGWKVARDNVIFNQFGFGLHGYAQTNTQLKNLVFDGNVLFNNGTPSDFESPNLHLGGTTVADNDTVTNNMVYFSPGVTSYNGNARIGFNATSNGTAVVANNYIVGGTRALDIGYWANLTMQSNTIVAPNLVVIQHDAASSSTQRWTANLHYHDPAAQEWQLAGSNYTFANWKSTTGALDQASVGQPSMPQVFVRPNRYEAGRATIVIYNWSLQASVAVNLSGVVTPGNRYELRNVQDIFGAPVASGIYGGGTINVPMTGVAPPQPIGGSFKPLIKTGPNFDAFIVTSAP